MEQSIGRGASRALGVGFDARAVAGRFAAEPAWFWLDGAGAAAGEPRISYLGLADEVRVAEPGREREFLGSIAPAAAGAPDTGRGEGIDPGAERIALPEARGFTGGWVAALGYEFGVGLLGLPVPGVGDAGPGSGAPRAPRPEPTALALRADAVVAIDHATRAAELRGGDEASLDRWLARYGALVDGLGADGAVGTGGDGAARGRAAHGDPDPDPDPEPIERPDTAAASRQATEPPETPRWRASDEQYLAGIEACLRAIRDGEAYVLCLTDTVEAVAPPAGAAAALAIFDRLRARGPALRGGVIVAGDRALVSASPERFLSVRGGEVRTDPIKGTRPRGADPASDAALARELAEDPKERSENLMIVDLMRNDLGSVCVPGSVGVDGFLRVETHPHVHQLVSTVRGLLRPGLGAADAVAACFPGGSMTGAPKRRAVELLAAIEPGPRGLYSGCFGWFDRAGDAELAMTIRSVELEPGRARVGAGGGITADSAPLRELEEKALKARPLLAALRGAGD